MDNFGRDLARVILILLVASAVFWCGVGGLLAWWLT
jgi:hypothetical protein